MRSEVAPALICPHCGALGPGGAAGSCASCGRPLARPPAGPPPLRRCPACGAPAPDDGRRSCPSCGLALAPEPQPDPAVGRRRRRRWPWLVVVPVVVAVLAAALVLPDDDVPPLTAQWQLDIDAALAGFPLVTGTTVLVATADGAVVAAGLGDGRARWRFVAGVATTLPPVAGEDIVLLAAGVDLFGIDVRTGGERWRSAGLGALSLAVADDAAYARNGTGDVVSIDLATGAERWRRQVAGAGSLAVADGTVVVATAGGMTALDAASGEPRWTWSGAGPEPPEPLAVDHVVVLEGDAGELIAIAVDDGTERWRAPAGPASSPPSGGGVVVVRGGPEELVAVAADTGRVRWRGGPARAGVGTDGTLVAATAADRLTVHDADTGETVADSQLPDGGATFAPVVVGLQVLVVAGDRLLGYVVP